MSRDSVVQMTRLTPTQRLEWLLEQKDIPAAHDSVRQILEQYERFLGTTNVPEEELISKFMSDKDLVRGYMKNANNFGQFVYTALNAIGNGSKLHRLLVV